MAGDPEDHFTDSRELYVLVEGDEWANGADLEFPKQERSLPRQSCPHHTTRRTSSAVPTPSEVALTRHAAVSASSAPLAMDGAPAAGHGCECAGVDVDCDERVGPLGEEFAERGGVVEEARAGESCVVISRT